MGQAKHHMEIADERGWYSVGKFVCAECIEDSFLQALIQDYVEHDNCDYCGRKANEDIAAPVDILISNLADTLGYHFAEPGDAGVPYETREGGWQANVVSTDDALLTLGFGSSVDSLFEDVVNAFSGKRWTEAPQGNWLGLSIHDAYMQSWETFAETVKHKSRYFFEAQQSTRRELEYDGLAGDSPTDILLVLNQIASDGLVQTITVGSEYHRVRKRNADENWPLDEENLSAPLNEKSTSGRMNPAGISYLYLASDQATALAEVVYEAPAEYAIGTFATSRALTVLNLVNLPELPSIFDAEGREIRELNLFLRGFIKAITRRIEKDGR